MIFTDNVKRPILSASTEASTPGLVEGISPILAAIYKEKYTQIHTINIFFSLIKKTCKRVYLFSQVVGVIA